MTEIWREFITEFGQVLLIVSVALALLQCFFGYRLLKVWVAVVGFALGFAVGFTVSALLIGGDAYIPAAIGIVVGILAALIAFKLYLAGVFLLCGASSFLVVQSLPFPYTEAWGIVLVVLGMIAFIVVGILAVKFARPCIILVTAISGASQAVDGLRAPVEQLAENAWMGWAAVAVLAVLGIVVQFKTTKN